MIIAKETRVKIVLRIMCARACVYINIRNENQIEFNETRQVKFYVELLEVEK